MNEQDFRSALRATMTAVSPPPPMSELPVLDAARRAERRRRARWAGAGSAAAAVGVIGAAVAVVAATSGAGGTGAVAPGVAPSSTGDQTSKTETSWPNGQTDRTATSGPEADEGDALLGELVAAAPPGFGTPDDLSYADPAYSGGPLRFSQAQYVDTVGGTEVWEYTATTPLTEGDGVGALTLVVLGPKSGATGDGCGVSSTFWGERGTCVEVPVGARKVGVFTADGAGGGGELAPRYEQWATYRAPDGTLVHLAQSTSYEGSAAPELARLPLSAGQLAELAADQRFQLD